MKQRGAASKKRPPPPHKTTTTKEEEEVEDKPSSSRRPVALVILLLLLIAAAAATVAVAFGWWSSTNSQPAKTPPPPPHQQRPRSQLPVRTPPPFAKDELLSGLQHRQDFETLCRDGFPSSMGNLTQRCCRFPSALDQYHGGGAAANKKKDDEPPRYQCLPNIVVLGAQKAGSTALVQYLLLVPQYVEFAGLKELHFFDNDFTFQNLKQQVGELFTARPEQDIGNRVVAESSPSYLADYKSCARMARLLSPDARYVALLRNPVQRTWSDMQMKHRRLFFQKEFLEDIIPTYHKELAMCWRKCNYQCHFWDFMQCLPERAGKHGRLSYLFRWIHKREPESQRFLVQCLASAQAALKCTTGEYARKFVDEVMPELPRALFDEAKQLNRTMARCCREDLNTTASLYRCGAKCFPRPNMMADVSWNHIFRSLYYPQLVNCLGAIPRQSLLVLNNEDLRLDPQTTLRRIFAHLQLPVTDQELALVVSATKEEMSKVLEDRFPDFEAVNGWKANNQPELKITPEIRTMLENFFRPHNRRLFDFLEMEPFPGWDV